MKLVLTRESGLGLGASGVGCRKKKTFNFGSNVSKTFVEGASIQKRNNYLKRHSK
jgi:hypothetical protein